MILSAFNSINIDKSKINEVNVPINKNNTDKLKEMPAELNEFFSVIPKAELHAHLAGSYPLDFVRNQLKIKGMPEADVFKATYTKEKYDNLTDFVNVYTNLSKSVKTAEELKAVTYSICMNAAKENVKYIELKISSQELNPEKLKETDARLKAKDTMYHAINDGIEQAKNELQKTGFHQVVKLMVTTERHESPETSMEDAKLAVKWSKEPNSSVVALDLAGDELNHSIDKHSETLKYAKENGLHLTIHAGETPHSEDLTPTQSMMRAIAYGTERIGHGLALFNDKNLIQQVKDKNIVIENCPSSNVATGVTTWDQKHLKRMIDENIKVAVCTDDQSMFNTDLSEEFRRLYEHGIITTLQDIKTLVKNGINAAFLPPQEKKEMEAEFDSELKAIEANPKFKTVIDKYLTDKVNLFTGILEKHKPAATREK
ncbi:MAG: amidohydrolase family protein [bacterium]